MYLDKEKILNAMKKKNIQTQTEMAERINISKSQFSQMLSKEYCPIKKNVVNLMDLLDLTIDDIIVYRNDDLIINETSENYMQNSNNTAILQPNQTSLFDLGFDRFDFKLENYKDVSKVSPKRKFNSIETFAGAGGLALGLEKAGFSHEALIEIDNKASQTLVHNRPEWKVIEEDINNISDNIENFVDDIHEIDLLSGGYPCQSFSYAGLRNGLEDTRGTLFYPFARILEIVKPKVFLAENVKGLVNHDKGNTLQIMIETFEDAGYNVSWNVLNSWDYGVAQKRERIFIVGIREDLKQKETQPFYFPHPHEYKPVLKDILMDVPESLGMTYSEKKHSVLELVPPGGSWVNLPDNIAKEYMGASYNSGGGKRGMARRLSWDEPSLTLTTSPVQKQTERCHPDETRPFTVREYARIQSFPDDWEFLGSMSDQYKQIGNAVPVNLAKEVGLAIVDYLNHFE